MVAIIVADVRSTSATNDRANYGVRFVLLVFTVCMILALFWQRESTTEVIEARQFLLRDSNGTIRAGLVMEQNEPVLFFADTNGKRISEYK
ncbi:MAG: hypothetical protein H9535_05695 [Ignavibacteria bacterium]|nr:hypothetical protein [Ignavibacteria bacterium]